MHIVLMFATIFAFITLMVKLFSKDENPFNLLDCHPGNANSIYVIGCFFTYFLTAVLLCLCSMYLLPFVPLFTIFGILYNFDVFTTNLKSTIKRKLQNFLKDDDEEKAVKSHKESSLYDQYDQLSDR
jgi:hypothetical protein